MIIKTMLHFNGSTKVFLSCLRFVGPRLPFNPPRSGGLRRPIISEGRSFLFLP